MATYNISNLRNVCLLGHGGSGKTSLAEALLYFTKSTDRLGTIADGNTVCDYDIAEIKRGFSLQSALAPVVYNGTKINFIDTPGYLDFNAEVLQALRVAGSTIIVIDGKAGMEVGTQLAWEYASDAGIPKSFFINKFDDIDAHFKVVFGQLRDYFGVSVCPLIVPMKIDRVIKGFINLLDLTTYVFDEKGNYTKGEIPPEFDKFVADYRNMLYESIAETSEELMEKFFAEEEITRDEAIAALKVGIAAGTIAPVICGSSTKMWCIDDLLGIITDSYPSFTDSRGEEKAIKDGETVDVKIDPDGPTALFVFKTVADPFVGKMTYFKVMNGTLKKDMVLKNLTNGAQEKFAHIYIARGKKQIEVDELGCGDIGMTAKLVSTNTNDTLSASDAFYPYAPIVFPEPNLVRAITPTSKGDEDKISSGMAKLLEEDYTIKYENNSETNQLLLSGLGDIHLDVITGKLKTRFNVSVKLADQKIAYRETIRKKVQAEGKHKKQSGGHGQYGHVRIEFGPGEAEGLTFTESVVGGAVPKGFFPAVEKGLQEAMVKGVLAGFPVVNLAANLYDGSYHDVDSSEMAFKIAANLAYKEGLPKANPVILEPVGELKIKIPDEMVGDVIGDLNKRRGRILGMNPLEGKRGYQIVEAEAPKSEMGDYSIALRAMSQGRGTYTYKFARYEEVPSNVAQKIIEDAKKESEN